MAHFLRTSAPQQTIDLEIVNVTDLVARYHSVLGTEVFRIKQTLPAMENCVRRFVLENCELTGEEKATVVRDSIADGPN